MAEKAMYPKTVFYFYYIIVHLMQYKQQQRKCTDDFKKKHALKMGIAQKNSYRKIIDKGAMNFLLF